MPALFESSSAGRAWALAIARGILGLTFLMAGIHKVFVLTPVGHVERFFLPFEDTFLPTWSLWAVGLAIPLVELIAGVFVFIGFKTRYAAVALGLVLVTVTFGHLLDNPFYTFYEHVFPRAVLLLFVLWAGGDDDRISVDGFLASRSVSRSTP